MATLEELKAERTRRGMVATNAASPQVTTTTLPLAGGGTYRELWAKAQDLSAQGRVDEARDMARLASMRRQAEARRDHAIAQQPQNAQSGNGRPTYAQLIDAVARAEAAGDTGAVDELRRAAQAASGDAQRSKSAGQLIDRSGTAANPADKYTVEQYQQAARNAAAAGDPEAQKRLAFMAAQAEVRRRSALEAAQEEQRRRQEQQGQPQGQRTFEITAPDGQTFRVKGVDPESAFADWQASGAQGTGQGENIRVQIPDGSIVEFPAGTSDETMSKAIQSFLAEQGQTQQQGMAQLSDMSSRPVVGGRDAQGIPNENQWAGGILPNPQQAVRNMRNNLLGDSDPTTLNRGEMTAAALNKAGEAMTMGLVGDEAAGAFDAATGRGDYTERRDFYRAQERQLEDQAPGVALGAEVAGALIGPGKGAGAFVNRGVGTAARIGRGAAVGAGTGAVYGAAEGEGGQDRATQGLLGGGTGAVGGAGFTALGQGFNRVAQRLSRDPAARAVVPTLEGLKAEAQGLYAAAEASGAKLGQGRMVSLRNSANNVLKNAGYNPRLHPRLSVVLDELDDLAKGPQGLQQVEQLRRIAGNAAQSMQPDERRLGSLVIDRIDDTIEGMGEGSKPLQQAREVWGRMRRMESVEALIEDASNSPNFEQALATKFRAMLRNPRKMRGFSSAERQAMARIASGKSVAGALQGLGKLMSPTGLMGAVTSGGAIMGAGPAGVAVPMAGMAARAAGNAGVRRQAENVLNTVGRTDVQRAAANAMLRRGNALAPLSGGGGLLAQYDDPR